MVPHNTFSTLSFLSPLLFTRLGMAEVYEKGVSPLTMDGTKALEYYERAIRLSPYNRKRMDLCISTFHSYKTCL